MLTYGNLWCEKYPIKLPVAGGWYKTQKAGLKSPALEVFLVEKSVY